jgi:putative SOS response-associated peptidase YedK
MCYYISITPSVTDIEQRFNAKFLYPDMFQKVYSASAFSYPSIPVITNEHVNQIAYYQWGLIPFWVKDINEANKIRRRTLNARAETIFEKPAFRHSIRSKRCLVIADGFFEWRHENKKKYPYYIRLASHMPFAIAGIWDTWINHDILEAIGTFSVITTRANSLLEKIHNTRKRMPVILQRGHENQWLEANEDIDAVRSLLKPYSASEMEAYTVPNVISRLGFNTMNPEVLNEFIYQDLPGLV